MDRITFTDENGVEVELEVLSMAEYEGDRYILVTEQLDADEEEEIDVFIMREDETEGDEAFYTVVDPAEEGEEFIAALLDILEDNIPEEYEEYEGEE